eukprot:scaffold276710_cov22-Prasinocladus_malaysianus.AAC.1
MAQCLPTLGSQASKATVYIPKALFSSAHILPGEYPTVSIQIAWPETFLVPSISKSARHVAVGWHCTDS